MHYLQETEAFRISDILQFVSRISFYHSMKVKLHYLNFLKIIEMFLTKE